MDVPGATYRQCDINDYDSLIRELAGFEAIVHLAAVPNPAMEPGREVFRVNDLGTFALFEAAAAHRIRRFVGASSINALGYFFGKRSFPIQYLPVDAEHPTFATDAYSFSKQVMEDVGRYFWNRDGIASVMLRLPGVMPHARVLELAEHGADRIKRQRELAEEILAMPDDERRNCLKRMHREYDAYRATGVMETPADGERPETPPIDQKELRLMHTKANFWAYLDDSDCAVCIEQALVAEYEGSHTMFVNAHKNLMGLDKAELAKLFYPVVPELRGQHPGDDCLVGIDRARTLLGFDPKYTV